MLLDLASAFQAIRTRSKNQFRVDFFLAAGEPSSVVRRPKQGAEVLAFEHGPGHRLVADGGGIEQPPEPRPRAPPTSTTVRRRRRPPTGGRLQSGKQQRPRLLLALLPAEEVDGDAAAREEHQGPGSRRRLVQEVPDSAKFVGNGGSKTDLEINKSIKSQLWIKYRALMILCSTYLVQMIKPATLQGLDKMF